MNKYTEIYLNGLDDKRAWIGKAISSGLGAAYQAAKPIVSQGLKDTFTSAVGKLSRGTKLTASASKSLGATTLDFGKGLGSGIGTVGKDYLNILKTPGMPIGQKILSLGGTTLSTPGKMLGQKPISAISAGEIVGAATPLIAAGYGGYSLLPEKEYLPRVPASRTTFLPSHEESSYFRDLYKNRTGRSLSQKDIDIATIRK